MINLKIIPANAILDFPVMVAHGGIVHLDETAAAVILQYATGLTRLMRVFRVPAELPDGSIIFDIGGGRFDHHQKGSEVRENGIKYAATGLVWREYGRKAISAMDPALTEDQVEAVWKKVEYTFIQAVDARDNGQFPALEEGSAPVFQLGEAIKAFNPNWDEPDMTSDDAFIMAYAVVEPIVRRTIQAAISCVKAQEIVRKAIAEQPGTDVLVLPQYVPWQGALLASPDAENIKFVVYPSLRGGHNAQNVVDHGTPRAEFPAAWRGALAQELKELSGVADATFCHPAGFLASADTCEGAVALAKNAL